MKQPFRAVYDVSLARWIVVDDRGRHVLGPFYYQQHAEAVARSLCRTTEGEPSE